MDVRCIDNARCPKYLTIGKIYKVINKDFSHYELLKDDCGKNTSFFKERFEIINTNKIYEVWT